MAIQKYDIRKPASEGGQFEARYWSPLNTPVRDAAGNVKWIIHYVEDVTDTVQRRVKATEMDAFAKEQRRIISELRAANLELAKQVSGNA